MKTFQFQIPFVRDVWRSKPAFADTNPAHHKLHNPSALMRGHAQKTSLINFSRAAHVLQIAKTVNFAQICKTIITFVSVYVVNMQFRPTPRCVKPSQPMRESFSVKHTNGKIAVRANTPRSAANKVLPSFSFFPDKHPRNWAIRQYLSNVVKRNIVIILHICFSFWLAVFYHIEFPE